MWWLAESGEEQAGSGLEQSLVMGVSNRETEASMRGGGQKDQRDGDESKATWALAGPEMGWQAAGEVRCT